MVKTYLGTGWEFARSGREEWRQARVPGHVHDDLLRHGLIEDPFYRMNEKECQWVDLEDWSYRCSFYWTPKKGMPRRILRFDGLDTVCSVFLNGDRIAEHDNMFLPLEVDVTSLLRKGANELRVEFSSAVRVAEERRRAYMAAEGIDASVSTFYERSFLRKAQYMFGWDWGPRLVSCGIWKPVQLLEYVSRITDVWARPRKVSARKWEVEVTWNVDEVDIPVALALNTEFASGSISETEANLGERKATLYVKNPELWQPGMGVEAKLYTLGIFLPGKKTDRWRSQLGKGIDVGFRTVELLREPDQWGESFEFLVNDTPVFCRGANWIPQHSCPTVGGDDRGSRQVWEMAQLNFNMVRIWGGCLYESDEFYRSCDQHGIMVWQDFPFACAYYPDDDATLSSIEKEARANIRRLRNHPSLVLWCGNNENQHMHEQQWGGDESPERFYGEKIYDELLPRVLKEEDPDRPYVHGSPSGKVEGKDSNMEGVGDSHCWEVWHGKGDWKHYEDSASRFSSEFGFASAPGLYTWSKAISKGDWKFDSEAVKWHDKTLKGYEKYISLIELHYPKIETLEDLVYYSQLNQRDALRHGIEHFIRSESCRGTLFWQYNDCWPAQSWAIRDFYGGFKWMHREIQRLYSPIVSTTRFTKSHVEFWLTNNSDEEINDHFWLMASARNLLTGEAKDVRRVLGQHDPVAVGKSALVASIPWAELDPLNDYVAHGYPDNYSFRILAEPKELKLQCPPITVHLDPSGSADVACASDMLDLMIYDPDDLKNISSASNLAFVERRYGSTFHGKPTIFFDHEPNRLVARSLAGFHEVEISRSPL